MIRRSGHQPVKDIKLPYEMSFADAANGRITGHLADVLGAECHQAGARAAPRCRGPSLAPGMTGTDYQNIEHVGSLSDFTGDRKSSETTNVRVPRGTPSFAKAESTEKGVEHVLNARAAS
jgi:hypothetical protein